VRSVVAPTLVLATSLLCCSTCSDSHARTASPARPAVAGLVSVGESTYWAGNYDSARILWRGALRRAREAGDEPSEARIITWLGLASWRKGDYKDARQQGESALAMKRRLHLDADLFKSYNALGLLAWNEGRLADAAALFDTAMAKARANGDREGVGKASGNLALVYGEMGEFAKAREGFAVMRQVGNELKDARIEGNALDN
jgi:tetratricopeptide (TPR) repeat protein